MNFSAAFEDLVIGSRFSSRGRTVTESDIAGFAALTGDWHPQHSDSVWARESVFGERIAHGMLTLSFAVGLVTFDPDRVVALRSITDVIFKRPVRIGDTIHVEGEITGLRPISDEVGLVCWSWAVRNQQGQLVCRARVDAMWRRDGLAAPAGVFDDEFVAIPL